MYKIREGYDDESIDVILKDLPQELQITENEYLKIASKILKDSVIKQLETLRTKNNREDYKHMAENVTSRIVKDEFGNKIVRIRGGHRTGTKWHLVNDGTFHSEATHFIDKALESADSELEDTIDNMLGGIF